MYHSQLAILWRVRYYSIHELRFEKNPEIKDAVEKLYMFANTFLNFDPESMSQRPIKELIRVMFQD